MQSLRWRLTLSYSLVTVAALLVVELIVMGLLFSYFVSTIDLTPENLIANLQAEWIPQKQSDASLSGHPKAQPPPKPLYEGRVGKLFS